MVLSNARRGFALLAEADSRLALGLIGLTAADAILPLGIAFVGKRIVDAVVLAAGGAARVGAIGNVAAGHVLAAGNEALLWVGVELFLMLLVAAVTQLNVARQTLLRSALGLEVNTRILEKAINVSYRHFEDPIFNDQLAQARREASTRPLDVVRQLLALGRNWRGARRLRRRARGFSAASIAAPGGLGGARRSSPRRASGASRSWLSAGARFESPSSALPRGAAVAGGERQGGEALLAERAAARALPRALRALPRRGRVAGARRACAALALRPLATARALRLLRVGRVARGRGRAQRRRDDALSWSRSARARRRSRAALLAIAKLYEDNLFMTNLFEYLRSPRTSRTSRFPRLPKAVPAGAPPRATPSRSRRHADPPRCDCDRPASRGRAGMPDTAPPPRIELDGVSFRYPDARRDSPRDLTLTIEPGETLALVGPQRRRQDDARQAADRALPADRRA